MIEKFHHSMDKFVLGLAVFVAACAPQKATIGLTSTPSHIAPQATFTQAPGTIPVTLATLPSAAPAVPAPWGIVANQSWQDAHTLVHPGDQLEFTAQGTWSHHPTDPQFANPYGPGGVDGTDPAAILPSAPRGSLVGRIGDQPPFLIGEHLTLTSEYRGKLWVSMNDNPEQFADNTGMVELVVGLTPKLVGPGLRLTSTRDGYTLVYPEGYFVVVTSTGICLTQVENPGAIPCDLPTTAALDIGDAHGQTAAQFAGEQIDPNDLNFRFDSHDMQVDGEPAMWISREGGDGVLTMVITVHGDRVYTWRFLSRQFVPSLGQEDQVMREIDQVQRLYSTVIDSFQFLD